MWSCLWAAMTAERSGAKPPPTLDLEPTMRVTGLDFAHPEIHMQTKVTAQIGSTQITIGAGKIAKLADGSVIVSCGETVVLTSAVSATSMKEGQDFFPLTVDYREKAAAVGKFPGGRS